MAKPLRRRDGNVRLLCALRARDDRPHVPLGALAGDEDEGAPGQFLAAYGGAATININRRRPEAGCPAALKLLGFGQDRCQRCHHLLGGPSSTALTAAVPYVDSVVGLSLGALPTRSRMPCSVDAAFATFLTYAFVYP